MVEKMDLAIKFRNKDYIEIRNVTRIRMDNWGLVCIDTNTSTDLIQFKLVEMVYMYKIKPDEYEWGGLTDE